MDQRRFARCTALGPSGAFCDRESVPLTPFPICPKHLTEAHLFVLDTGRALTERSRGAPSGHEERRAKAMQEQSQVYYIRERDGLVKIGYSTNIKARLTSLRLPADSVMATEPGDADLERARHQQFAHLREGRAERFRVAPELTSHIAMLVDHFGPPKITTYTSGASPLR